MRLGRSGKGLVAAFAALGVGGLAIAAQVSQSTAFDRIEPGQWQLSEAGGATRALCVADPRILIQLEHGPASCSRYVIANEPRTATIHYTCPGAGHGRTTLTIEAGGSFRLQTQGILQGAPFDTDYEARRVGACPTAVAQH